MGQVLAEAFLEYVLCLDQSEMIDGYGTEKVIRRGTSNFAYI
jgi:hypothetical protein